MTTFERKFDPDPAYGRVYLSGVGGNGAHRGIIWASSSERPNTPGGKLWEDDKTHDPELAYQRMYAAAEKLTVRPIQLFRSTGKDPSCVLR